jgi:gamma-glutamylcyclotransferase (GGCT)/AIG2-like uncharacterized protein YtfP
MEPKLLFVYGTLKRPFHNSNILEKSSKYLGEAVTKGKYYLADCGFPYLVSDYLLSPDKAEKSLPVLGQVWEVSDEETMARLDSLEGVKYGHYDHMEIWVCFKYTNNPIKVLTYHTGNADVQKLQPSNIVNYKNQSVYSWNR